MLVEDAERLLFQVAHEDRASDFRNVAEILEEEIDRLEQLPRATATSPASPRAFRDLDKITAASSRGT